MEEAIKAYWRSVLPVEWQDEQGIQNYEDVAHVMMVERGMSIEEARETIRPLSKEQPVSEQAVDTRLLEERKGITFVDCLHACLHSEMLPEWERLWGKHLIATSAIDRMIDEATGYDMAVMREFADFVYTYVFSVF